MVCVACAPPIFSHVPPHTSPVYLLQAFAAVSGLCAHLKTLFVDVNPELIRLAKLDHAEVVPRLWALLLEAVVAAEAVKRWSGLRDPAARGDPIDVVAVVAAAREKRSGRAIDGTRGGRLRVRVLAP